MRFPDLPEPERFFVRVNDRGQMCADFSRVDAGKRPADCFEVDADTYRQLKSRKFWLVAGKPVPSPLAGL